MIDHARMDAEIAAKQAEFDEARVVLECCLNLAAGELNLSFPEGSHYITKDREGMARLGSRIEDVANCYDRFQAAMGLRKGEGTRFADFFTGREGVCEEPPPWHRAEKTEVR